MLLLTFSPPRKLAKSHQRTKEANKKRTKTNRYHHKCACGVIRSPYTHHHPSLTVACALFGFVFVFVCVLFYVCLCENRTCRIAEVRGGNQCRAGCVQQVHSHTQTHRHSDTQTLRHSDTQTLRHSDTQQHTQNNSRMHMRQLRSPEPQALTSEIRASNQSSKTTRTTTRARTTAHKYQNQHQQTTKTRKNQTTIKENHHH